MGSPLLCIFAPGDFFQKTRQDVWIGQRVRYAIERADFRNPTVQIAKGMHIHHTQQATAKGGDIIPPAPDAHPSLHRSLSCISPSRQ